LYPHHIGDSCGVLTKKIYSVESPQGGLSNIRCLFLLLAEPVLSKTEGIPWFAAVAFAVVGLLLLTLWGDDNIEVVDDFGKHMVLPKLHRVTSTK
jgi:hypothetical protein